MHFLTVLFGAIACVDAIAVKRDRYRPRDIDILKITSVMVWNHSHSFPISSSSSAYAQKQSQLPVAALQGGLANYTLESFEEQGFDENVLRNIERAADDARQISQYLSDAIVARGETPAAPETYEFPSTSLGAFVGFLSGVLGVGTSLYVELQRTQLAFERTRTDKLTNLQLRRSRQLRPRPRSPGMGHQHRGRTGSPDILFSLRPRPPPSTNALETPISISAAFTGTRNFVTSAIAPEIEALPFEFLPFLFTDCPALADGRFIYTSKAIEDAEKSGTEIFAVVLEGLDQVRIILIPPPDRSLLLYSFPPLSLTSSPSGIIH